MKLDDQDQSFLNGIFTLWASRTTRMSISTIKGKKRTQNNDDACGSCGGLCLGDSKKKNGSEWISVHFTEYGITQHAKKSCMNFTSCAMVVSIPMTVNNHTMSIQKDSIGSLNHQTNSHGLRKIATHVQLSFQICISHCLCM
jgi:hypothetical protein